MKTEMIVKIQKITEGDWDAVVELIERFQPLLRKYAYLLNYKDAYEDMQVDFIEFLLKLNPAIFHPPSDGIITEYIRVAVMNMYRARVKNVISHKSEIPISQMEEQQQALVSMQYSTIDNESVLLAYGLHMFLGKDEYEIIRLYYVMQYTDAEIARMRKKTRQAVQQKRKKALKKIKDILTNEH